MNFHPIFFIDSFLEMLGMSHLAHMHHVTYTWLVMAFLIICSIILAKGVQLIPTKGQNFLEVFIGGLEDFIVEITGPEGKAFFPFLATLFLFILVSNLIGLAPGMFSPTADWNTTLAMALCVFIYTHVLGIKYHGAKYYKHFIGPVWWLAPLMIVIELIGHLARILSLSVRLLGNIYGKEMVLLVLFVLAGLYLAPLPILFLGILVSFIQALVFMLLSTIYFVGSMEHAH